MKKIFIILLTYLCVAAMLLTLFTSCNASHKLISVNKSHVDSSVVETKNNNHVLSVDSIGVKKGNKSYEKTTTIQFEPIEIEPDYFIVDTVPLIIKNKAGKQKIYLPKTTIVETGNVVKSDSGHVVKKDSNIVKEQKKVNVVSDKKEVVKQKWKISWNWWYLLAIIPLCFLFPGIRTWIGRKIKMFEKWL